MGKYFGTDGIRGRANGAKMTPEIAMRVGLAAGRIFQRGDYKHQVVVGKDTRLSGYMLENAIIAGFTAAGVNVLRLGPVPTPAVAMLTRSMRADIGVMISASHNPYEDNGIKLFGPDGFKLSDAIEAQIEAALDDRLDDLYAPSSEIGKATHIDSAVDRYIEYAKRTLPRDATLGGMRIVVDCANGAAYKAAPRALWELGAEVVPLGVEPNGTNINDGVGSTEPEALRAKVREVRADIGIALDGDADRVIIVDENAQIVDGDQLMAAIAEDWHRKQLLRHGGVVATVMSNLGFERHLSSLGLTLRRTKVGDRHVVEAMRRDGYNLGGEQSGHIVMSDFRHYRRRPRRGAAASQLRARRGPPRVGGLPALRPGAAASQERRQRPGRAGARRRARRHSRHGGAAGRFGSSAHPPVGHRAAHPHHGRGRRPAHGRGRGGRIGRRDRLGQGRREDGREGRRLTLL